MLSKTRTILIKYNVEVRFNEVDSYRIVHNSHYYNYFDIGRTYFVNHFLRKDTKDESFGDREDNYYYLVLKSQCRFNNFAKHGDKLKLETSYKFDPKKKGALIELQHCIYNTSLKRKIAEGYTKLGIVQKNYEIMYNMPNDLRCQLMQNIEYYINSPVDFIAIK